MTIFFGRVAVLIGIKSASYASTASHLLPGPLNTSAETGFEHRPTASPRSTTSSAISNIQPGMTSTALSPSFGASTGLELPERDDGVAALLPGTTTARIGAPQEPRGSIPVQMMAAQSLGPWQPQYASAPQYPQQLPTAGRPSWDMGAGGYLQQSHIQVQAPAAQPLHYSYPGPASEQTTTGGGKGYTATTQQTMAG